MLKFLLSFAAVFTALFIWGWVAQAEWLRYQARGVLWLATLLIALPSGGAWLAMEVMERIRPRRAFDPRVKRPRTLVLAGVVSGLLGVVLATAMITLVDKLSDAVALGAAAVLATTLVLLVLSRKRAGECVHCGYDLSAAQDARCTECGAMYSMVGATASAEQSASAAPRQTPLSSP